MLLLAWILTLLLCKLIFLSMQKDFVFFMSRFGFLKFAWEYVSVLSPSKSGVTRTSRSWLRQPALCSVVLCRPSCHLQAHPGSFLRAWRGSAQRVGSCSLWAWVMRQSTSDIGSHSLGKNVGMKGNHTLSILPVGYTLTDGLLWLCVQWCSPSCASFGWSGGQPGLWGCDLPHAASEPGGLQWERPGWVRNVTLMY